MPEDPKSPTEPRDKHHDDADSKDILRARGVAVDGTELEIETTINIDRFLESFPRYTATFRRDDNPDLEAMAESVGPVHAKGRVDDLAFDCAGMGCRLLDPDGGGIRVEFPVINPDADLADDAVGFLPDRGDPHR